MPDARLYPLLFAPFIGSFLGVLIARLPVGRPFVLQRSACETCGHALGIRDLVPIFSYLALRGRCRHCGAPIGIWHLGVELAALAIAVSALVVEGDAARMWMDCGLGWTLLALAWIDARTMVLPDALTLPLLLAGLSATVWLDPAGIGEHASASLLGYAAFIAISVGYRHLRGQAGLGAGDAKLMGVAGAWLGLSALSWVVLLAAVFGLIIAGAHAMRGAVLSRTTMVAFGPCLAMAIWIMRLWDL